MNRGWSKLLKDMGCEDSTQSSPEADGANRGLPAILDDINTEYSGTNAFRSRAFQATPSNECISLEES